MRNQQELEAISAKIRQMQNTGTELINMGKDIPALSKNMTRIMASLKMLELDICDVIDLSNKS